MATFTFKPKTVTRYLCTGIGILGLAHLISITIGSTSSSAGLVEAVKIFDLDRERNVPTLFTTCLILANASLFYIVHRASQASRNQKFVWPLLSAIFAFLALDEFGALHEKLIDPVRNVLPVSGVFHFTWVIPYGIAAIGLAIAVFPTIWQLPRGIRKSFIAAAILYGGGALGFEMIGGLLHKWAVSAQFLYGLIVGGEELLELAGLTMLTYALLKLLEQNYNGLNLVMPGRQPRYDYDYLEQMMPPNEVDLFSSEPNDRPTVTPRQ